MKISHTGLEFIKEQEGFFPFVYDDLVYPTREWRGEAVRGTLTIGVGHTNAAKHPLKIKKGLRITEELGLEILATDLGECEDQVNRMVKVPVTQGQFDALVSFCYNCGSGNLAKLIIPLNKGDYDGTRNKFHLYTRSKGKVLRGLVNRRAGEVALWDSKPAKQPVDDALPSQVDDPQKPNTMDHVIEKGLPAAGILATATLDWKVAAVIMVGVLIGLGVYLWNKRKNS